MAVRQDPATLTPVGRYWSGLWSLRFTGRAFRVQPLHPPVDARPSPVRLGPRSQNSAAQATMAS